jgi:hypothetical protein
MKNNNQKNILLLVIVLLLVVVYVFYKKGENSDRRVVNDSSGEQERTKEKTPSPVPLKKETTTTPLTGPHYFNVDVQTLQKYPELQNWKIDCDQKGGEFIGVSYSGIFPQTGYSCGFSQATDADLLCKSENQVNICSSCDYGSSCGPAAGDFGPEHCYCNAFKSIETYTTSFNFSAQ